MFTSLFITIIFESTGRIVSEVSTYPSMSDAFLRLYSADTREAQNRSIDVRLLPLVFSYYRSLVSELTY